MVLNGNSIYNMNNLKQAITLLKERGEYSKTMSGVLQLIIEDKMNSIDLRNHLSQHGIDFNYIKQESLSVIIDYANLCLEDGILTTEEMHNIFLLKLFFKIKEGDFYRFGKEFVVNNILTMQLQKMYKDGYIDSKEALMKVDLQALFGLSYDQFLKIVNNIAKESLDRGADIKDLDTFFLNKK